jgi:hypothetical protein
MVVALYFGFRNNRGQKSYIRLKDLLSQSINVQLGGEKWQMG